MLRQLYNRRCIGGRHTFIENTLKGFPKNDRGQGKSALDYLVKINLIILKSTSYGKQISLNPRLIKDVKQIIDPN